MKKMMGNYTEKEIWDAIHTLSDIRAGFDCFDPRDADKYDACSLGIQALKKIVSAGKS